jgi:hypothetical protein
MTEWRVIAGGRRVTFCPVALDLRDEFTGAPAFGPISLDLELRNGADWVPTALRPTRNLGGIFLYTGLGRAVDPTAAPLFRVRIRISAEYYRPVYQMTDDAIEFDVPTYNDSTPPVLSPLVPAAVMMLPTAAYPFGSHIRRIHGRVLDPGGAPLADARVEADSVERVMTDPSGGFALPLRWQAANASVNAVASYPRGGLSAARIFTLPADLSGNHDVTVT